MNILADTFDELDRINKADLVIKNRRDKCLELLFVKMLAAIVCRTEFECLDVLARMQFRQVWETDRGALVRVLIRPHVEVSYDKVKVLEAVERDRIGTALKYLHLMLLRHEDLGQSRSEVIVVINDQDPSVHLARRGKLTVIYEVRFLLVANNSLMLVVILSVPASSDIVYTPLPLAEYDRFDRLKIRAAAFVFHWAIRLVSSTVKFETRGMEHFDEVTANGRVPIYTFWHDRIFLGTYFFRDRGIVIMTSQSFDGEYIARFIRKFGYGAIRGSSTRGGVRALVEMIRELRRGLPMGFSVDGPKGPRYKVKPGPVLLASKTGNPMVPFVLQPRSFWTLKSWDKMQIPRPFTRCLVGVADPIYVPADASSDIIEVKLRELEDVLLRLNAEAESWLRDT